MGYNQKQIALLALAKDLGDNIGLVAGKISKVSPTWGVYLVGAVQNLVGYGLVWLVVTHRVPSLPLWASFPENRGAVAGILKGFVGLSSAILTQMVALLNNPDQASLIFIIAVGPSTVATCLMFIIRPIHGLRQARTSESSTYSFIYSIWLLLAVYLKGVLLVENTMELNPNIIKLFTVILITLLLIPVIIPILLVFFLEPKMIDEETFLLDPPLQQTIVDETQTEEEKPPRPEILPLSERLNEVVHFHARFFQSVARVVKKIQHEEGPHLGEDFTLTQALCNIDFWLIFFSPVLVAGAGLTIINNMGQIWQSLGDYNAKMYISIISIFNFLGRVGGGYFSEVITRNFAYSRLVALAVVQLIMAIGFCYYAIGLVGQLYVVTILTGLGYGAHWAIVIATASELFGLKTFGALYNFNTMARPAGSLFLSVVQKFIGTNGETYYDTATLVSCIQNFPKGFCGLSEAMLTQFYGMINGSNEALLILMIAVERSLIVTALMFILSILG
ncbi:hypothetical protein L6164_014867 [Bauhinia variegata]|uniref:Uncharacterized protein n=1 Tax=Bauhinia variegata TaxID=167791 RepID=A0ACB9NIJ4_BAUVA|nr:hypothetical protein L6164_014867 [Bauhinia variegata]